jgi:formylglycine-generating enzyme required for sulfatase activity
VVRGGSWLDGQVNARAFYRVVLAPVNRSALLGLRVVRSSPSLA